MAQWSNVPINDQLVIPPDESILSNALARLENAYVNEATGQSRFPGRTSFASLTGTKTYLSEWRDNLIAATDEGKFYRMDSNGNVTDVTGIQLSGGRRPVFDRTENELVVAAGGAILRLASSKSQILSASAPDSTHVAFVDGYLIAIEPYSGRFYHSSAGEYRTWDPLDVFTAEGKPDDLNACAVTPYRELLLCGEDSIEQFERLASDTTPFYRRWSAGEGLFAPYTLLPTDNGTYGVNKLREFSRFSQQVARPESDQVSFQLETIDDWDEAWTTQIHIRGQKWLVLQAPNATNPYGTKGVTLLFDYRGRHWAHLYDWDQEKGIPTRWAPYSYQALWGRHFVGVPGGVEELTPTEFSTNGHPQRFLVRTGHIGKWSSSRIDNFRLRLKRGGSSSNASREHQVGVRVSRDAKPWSRWKFKDLGRYGEREMVVEFGGMGMVRGTWQFDIQVTDAAVVEIVGAQVLVERIKW